MRKTLLFVSMLVGVIGVAHCSGDDTTGAPPADSGPADSGTDAKATGAGGSKADSGGNPADSGGFDGAAEGSTGTGGADAGTVPGKDGSVDADADAASCPATQPAPNASCNAYAGLTCGGCTCPATGQRRWTCPSDAGQPEAVSCPAQQPADNTSCSGFGGGTECSDYGTVSCFCKFVDSTWWCIDEAVAADAGCPATMPSNGQACRMAMTCEFPTQGQTCVCPNGQRQRWRCGVDGGTDAAPHDGGGDATDASSDAETDAQADVEVDAADSAAE